MTADRACFILEGGITLLWPLSLDDDNWQSMLHILGINNHPLSVVMRQWKLTEHVSYTREILPCSDRCHKTMTTDGAFFILEGYFNILWPLSWDGACFILEVYFTMLWPLSWDDDNWRSMFFIPKGWLTMLLPLLWDDGNWQSRFHTLGMYNHALSVVIMRWQLTEHVSYLMNTSPCSDPCYETLTTDGAWFITLGIHSHAQTNVIRPWQLTELFHTWGIYYHVLTVVMRRWQLTEHVAYLRSE